MYADWMKKIKLEVTPEDLEQYKEDKKRINIDNFINKKNN